MSALDTRRAWIKRQVREIESMWELFERENRYAAKLSVHGGEQM